MDKVTLSFSDTHVLYQVPLRHVIRPQIQHRLMWGKDLLRLFLLEIWHLASLGSDRYEKQLANVP